MRVILWAFLKSVYRSHVLELSRNFDDRSSTLATIKIEGVGRCIKDGNRA